METPKAPSSTSTPDAAAPTGPGPGWAAIEHAYCTTKQSARDIGRGHGVSHTAINKRAKAAGWKRPEPAGDTKAKTVSVSAAAADPAPVPEPVLGAELEPRQQRFVDEYLVDLNGTQAYMRAYGCSEKAARTNAARLLANAGIQDAIAAGRAKTAATLGLTRERVLAEYAKLAFFDMRQAYHDSGALKLPHELDEDAAAAIAAYETVEMSGGDREAPPLLVRKLKWADKRAALDSIMKAQGWNKSDVGRHSQCQTRSMPGWWPDATRRTQNGVNGGVPPVKQLADLVKSIASFPAIPHKSLLSFSVVNPRSLLHANTPSTRGDHCVALTS